MTLAFSPLALASINGRSAVMVTSANDACVVAAEGLMGNTSSFVRLMNQRAAELAVQTVRQYRAETGSDIHVIFNVFKDIDDYIYRELLG